MAGYAKAAVGSKNGSGYAAYLQGFLNENGIGRPKNIVSAVWFYRVATSRSDTLGQVSLGRLLVEGKGISHDPVRARDLFLQAAKNGNKEAQARLGKMLMQGEGGPKNTQEGLQWLETASDHPISKHIRGLRSWMDSASRQERASALALLKQAADSGLADAQVSAAKILVSEDSGSFRDTGTAIRYLASAAENEHPEALAIYGVRLIKGNGVPVDETRGFAMLERSASLGNDHAARMIVIQRKLIENKAEIARATEALCKTSIKLYNRGTAETDEGAMVFNTRHGKRRFERIGG